LRRLEPARAPSIKETGYARQFDPGERHAAKPGMRANTGEPEGAEAAAFAASPEYAIT
jgi:hypothetical protein